MDIDSFILGRIEERKDLPDKPVRKKSERANRSYPGKIHKRVRLASTVNTSMYSATNEHYKSNSIMILPRPWLPEPRDFWLLKMIYEHSFKLYWSEPYSKRHKITCYTAVIECCRMLGVSYQPIRVIRLADLIRRCPVDYAYAIKRAFQ